MSAENLDQPLDPDPASPKSLGQMLLEGVFIEPDRLSEAERIAGDTGVPLQRVLVTEEYVTPDTVAIMLSFLHNVPIADIAAFKVLPGDKPRDCINGEFARQKHVLPVTFDNKEGRRSLILAMEDPTDAATIAEVQEQIGMPVQPVVLLGNLYRQLAVAYPSNP